MWTLLHFVELGHLGIFAFNCDSGVMQEIFFCHVFMLIFFGVELIEEYQNE
jgi:hypothetical protein